MLQRLYWAGILIIAAVLVVLNELLSWKLSASFVINLWPMALVVYATSSLISRGLRGWSIAVLFIGVWMFAYNFNLLKSEFTSALFFALMMLLGATLLIVSCYRIKNKTDELEDAEEGENVSES